MNNKSKLFEAARNNDLENIKYLLEHGANLHACDDRTLRLAAENGYLETVKHLLEQGADLHANKDEALRKATQNGHLQVVKYLLEQGADSDRISEKILNQVLKSYDLQIKKLSPRLSSFLLKIKFVKQFYKHPLEIEYYLVIRKNSLFVGYFNVSTVLPSDRSSFLPSHQRKLIFAVCGN